MLRAFDFTHLNKTFIHKFCMYFPIMFNIVDFTDFWQKKIKKSPPNLRLNVVWYRNRQTKII